MHNNGYIDRSRSSIKEFYTIVEAAILWARTDGVKNASDPRISHYRQVILDALKRGELVAATEPSENPSSSSTISFIELKKWVAKYFANSKLALLFKDK